MHICSELFDLIFSKVNYGINTNFGKFVYPLRIVSNKRFELIPNSFKAETKVFLSIYYIQLFNALVTKVGINENV